MKSYFKHTLESLDKVKIKYFIGADSLVGLGEEKLFKYSQNLKIYICEYNFIKISILFFILLKKKIVLKPKIENGTLMFKIRYKPNLTTKDKTWIKCFVMRKNKQNYYVSIGNKKSHFEFEDIKITNNQLLITASKNKENINEEEIFYLKAEKGKIYLGNKVHKKSIIIPTEDKVYVENVTIKNNLIILCRKVI